jgi:putative metallohydrolase (TIGR04338 family)
MHLLAVKEAHMPRRSQSKETEQRVNELYLVEELVASQSRVRGRAGVRQLVRDVRSGEAWRRRWGKTRPIVRYTGRGAQYAYGGRTSGGKPAVILPENALGRRAHTILHELAHCLSPRPSRHDRDFCRRLLHLVREYEGAFYARELCRVLKDAGVTIRRRVGTVVAKGR